MFPSKVLANPVRVFFVIMVGVLGCLVTRVTVFGQLGPVPQGYATCGFPIAGCTGEGPCMGVTVPAEGAPCDTHWKGTGVQDCQDNFFNFTCNLYFGAFACTEKKMCLWRRIGQASWVCEDSDTPWTTASTTQAICQ